MLELPLGVAVSVSQVREPIFEDGDPAYENDTCAAREAGKEHYFHDACREEHQRVNHIDAN